MQYLTVKDVARMLKVSPTTVRRHIKSGKLKAVKVGGAVRVPEETLNDLREAPAEDRDRIRERWRAALDRSAQLRKRILDRRGGVPLPDSTPIIRAMREGRLR